MIGRVMEEIGAQGPRLTNDSHSWLDAESEHAREEEILCYLHHHHFPATLPTPRRIDCTVLYRLYRLFRYWGLIFGTTETLYHNRDHESCDNCGTDADYCVVRHCFLREGES